MSVTISNCNQICNAPTNLSPSKMLYTFPKQSRFLKRRTIYCDKFYQLKNTFAKRYAGFGYGNKYDFTKQSPSSPPPNTYHIPDEAGSPKKGFAFGESRQNMMITGPLVDTIINKNPGPGNYEPKALRKQLCYSLSPKIMIENKEEINRPGPGQYATPFSINKDGKYFQAKYKNSCVRNFGKSLGRSETEKKLNRMPGPGAYDVCANQDISPKGRYCLSRSQNCLTRTFGASTRNQLRNGNQTPGPGNYRLPSEFGYYASKKCAEKAPETNKENIEEKV